MKIAILGYADQGKSTLEYWNKPGNEITICDQNPDLKLPENAKSKLGKDYLKGLGEFDLIVRTPSIHPRQIVEANSPDILSRVTTNTNEFFKVCPTKNIIGVTGTKGKGTTSTLIAKMLEASGKKVHLGGNIGIPPLDLLSRDIQPDDWVVLELANFQLIDLRYSPKIGVVLMVESEHMDWHTDMAEYTRAKEQMFSHQTSDDIAIYFGHDEQSKAIALASPGVLIPYMREPGAEVIENIIKVGGQTICSTKDIKLLGKHNLQNVCAAITAVWQVLKDIDALKKVLTSFSGLEHRLEFVREVNGVKYYNDSFGTTPSTAKVAVEAFKEPKIVILGGSDKGAEYDTLAKAVANNNVEAVIVIGKTGRKIAESLFKIGYNSIVRGGETMDEIIEYASQLASPGYVVLLSPACASFDLFKNYKHRGEQFKLAVSELK